MDCKLIVNAPGAPPMEFVVGEDPVVLGRDASCDIPVPSQYVSRRHLEVRADGDRVLLTDLGGRNPIMVNGQPAGANGVARAGDVIQIADVTIDVKGADVLSTGTVVFMPSSTPAAPLPPVARPAAPAAASTPTPAQPASGGIRSVWQGQDLGPGGTLTIMFTDLEQSTSIVQELGEREAYRLMSTHHQVLREQFKEYRGHEPKRLGDGFLVLFASARDGLHCAVQIQRKLAAMDAATHAAPIRVRIGIHIGEVLWDENDIFGSAVNFAARVSAEAQGGEVLISALLREVISISGEFTFGEERTASLKGFKGTHHLTPLVWQEPAPAPTAG
jgi:class 3 adenylate cyclase